MRRFSFLPALALLVFALAAPAFATTGTLNLRTGGTTGFPAHMAANIAAFHVTVDFAEHTTQTAGSVTQLCNIPAKSWVLGVGVEVLTAEGGTCTAKVGDAADDDAYATAANLNSATSAFSFNATTSPAGGAGKYYTSAGVLQLTHGHDTDKAKARVTVVYLKLP
jgi:hypothetical protein